MTTIIDLKILENNIYEVNKLIKNLLNAKELSFGLPCKEATERVKQALTLGVENVEDALFYYLENSQKTEKQISLDNWDEEGCITVDLEKYVLMLQNERLDSKKGTLKELKEIMTPQKGNLTLLIKKRA